MEPIFFLIKIIPVMIAAILLGRWFQAEFKQTTLQKKPWYSAYISIPGLIILLIILVVPIALWLRSH
jgi:hypothetical protein